MVKEEISAFKVGAIVAFKTGVFKGHKFRVKDCKKIVGIPCCQLDNGLWVGTHLLEKYKYKNG